MKKSISVTALLSLFVLASSVLPSQTQSSVDQQLRVSTTESLTSMPLTFTENQGQWDEKVMFRANAGGATMWFTTDGAYYQFTRRVPGDEFQGAPQLAVGSDSFGHESDSIETMMIKASFVGANFNPAMRGEDVLEYKCNYFIGNDPTQWHTDVPSYSAVVYEEVYAGIDLKYYGNGKEMEYDFIVSPGADPSQIMVQYDGAESVSINAEGELVVETRWGEVIERRPVVYQLLNDTRVPVDGRYQLVYDNVFSFSVGDDYDRCLALVIDPVLSYSTYLGGSNWDRGVSIAVDGSGAAYVTGYTESPDFPTENGFQETLRVFNDVFVTKLSADGNSLVYSTY
ncbi:MAG: SBBP repeat-containing protein, partial [candidate division Zixibacteria bacterium]